MMSPGPPFAGEASISMFGAPSLISIKPIPRALLRRRSGSAASKTHLLLKYEVESLAQRCFRFVIERRVSAGWSCQVIGKYPA
jgi:hypothetical protein